MDVSRKSHQFSKGFPRKYREFSGYWMCTQHRLLHLGREVTKLAWNGQPSFQRWPFSSKNAPSYFFLIVKSWNHGMV